MSDNQQETYAGQEGDERSPAVPVAWAARSGLALKAGPALALVAALTLGVLAIVLACAMAGAVFQSSTVVWPVPVATDTAGGYRAAGWSVTSGFGWRADPLNPQQVEFHEGVDLAGQAFCRRCPAAALFDATVTYVGWDNPGAEQPHAAAGGQTVRITSAQEGFEALYAHLEPYRLYVQLQGRIADRYGRYEAYDGYQPVGHGELQPDMADGEISVWCAGDMPRFVPERVGPGTVMFTYDRPANCRTTVSWGQRGGGWEGWIPDEPAGRPGEEVSLTWQTPVDAGRAAGDVALRFRAHLVPPPPPPTATPAISGSLELGQGLMPPKSSAETSSARPATAARCERVAGGSRCTWRLGALPLTNASSGTFTAHGSGSAMSYAAAYQAMPAETATLPPSPVATSATPEPTREPLSLSLAASHPSPAVGQVFSLTGSIFSWQGAPQSIAVQLELDPQLELLDVSTTAGSCSGAEAHCLVRAWNGAPATVRLIVRASDARPLARVSVRMVASAEGVSVAQQVVVKLSNLVITPEAWPPPTYPPTATRSPTAPVAYPHPVQPTTVPQVFPAPAPCFQAVVAALSRQGARYSQGGALPGDPRGPDGLPLPRTGPNSFDCSGLVWWAYAQAGVAIGSNTYQQLDDGVALPCTLDDLRGAETRCWALGDLVFLRYSGGQHVAIYAGQGLFMDCFNHRVGCVLHDVSQDPFYRAHFLQARRIVSGCEEMTLDPGTPVAPPLDGAPQGDQAGLCAPGQPSFSGAVETIAGCGPPVRPGDKVHQLDSIVGFVGLSGATTGPHLHLGLRVRSYDGSFRATNVCTAEWLRGLSPPPDASCWTEMADPLDFLPRALGGERLAGGTVIPEGAPYQLPPPGHPDSLVVTPVPGATPAGQYWSPYADGGRYGGGSVLEWLRSASCAVWRGWGWCN